MTAMYSPPSTSRLERSSPRTSATSPAARPEERPSHPEAFLHDLHEKHPDPLLAVIVTSPLLALRLRRGRRGQPRNGGASHRQRPPRSRGGQPTLVEVPHPNRDATRAAQAERRLTSAVRHIPAARAGVRQLRMLANVLSAFPQNAEPGGSTIICRPARTRELPQDGRSGRRRRSRPEDQMCRAQSVPASTASAVALADGPMPASVAEAGPTQSP